MVIRNKLANCQKDTIMLKSLNIHFISADSCSDCEAMRATLMDAIAHSSYDQGRCKINEIDSEKDEAVDLALEYDINDLPACIIGNFSFCGKDNYSYKTLLEAIEKTWEDDTGERNHETNMPIY